VLSADYNRYMDIQQAINLRLHRELTELGIVFAYPTQKLYLVQPPSSDAPPASGGDSDRLERRAA
jgi:small-conductance mechanosensitive channel